MNRYLDLTPREKYIYGILLEIKHDSVWGVAIELFRANATPYNLRELIEQLTSQTRDNPESMARIIGDELTGILLQNQTTAA